MKKPTKHDCAGCRDDFYNGNNPLGVQECWSLKDAKFTKAKFVHMSAVPPWNMPAETVPNCYRRQGFVRVKPEQTS